MEKKHESGFTLIELLITIVVASILIALAVPAFHGFVQNNRVASQANELVSTMALARSEAIKRKGTVAVCISADGASCTGASWDQGWLVFADPNNNGTVDAGDTIIRIWSAILGGSTITPNTGTSSVVFDRLGGANNTVIFQVRIPNCRGNRARDMTLRTTGSIEMQAANC